MLQCSLQVDALLVLEDLRACGVQQQQLHSDYLLTNELTNLPTYYLTLALSSLCSLTTKDLQFTIYYLLTHLPWP